MESKETTVPESEYEKIYESLEDAVDHAEYEGYSCGSSLTFCSHEDCDCLEYNEALAKLRIILKYKRKYEYFVRVPIEWEHLPESVRNDIKASHDNFTCKNMTAMRNIFMRCFEYDYTLVDNKTLKESKGTVISKYKPLDEQISR